MHGAKRVGLGISEPMADQNLPLPNQTSHGHLLTWNKGVAIGAVVELQFFSRYAHFCDFSYLTT